MPKNAATRELHSTRRKPKQSTCIEALTVDATNIESPAWLSEWAASEFNRIKALLGKLRSQDVAVLTAYAIASDNMRRAQSELDRDGLTVRTPLASPRGEILGEKITKHPASTILNAERAAMMNTAAKLGLSIADRARLGDTGDDDDENDVNSILRRAGF